MTQASNEEKMKKEHEEKMKKEKENEEKMNELDEDIQVINEVLIKLIHLLLIL